MRTIRGRVRIPARPIAVALRTVTCGALLATAVAACGSDDQAADTSVANTADSTAISASSSMPSAATTTVAGAGTGSTDVEPTITVATVAPDITIATVAPETTTAESPEAPDEAVISVTVGVDSGSDRIEFIPLGTTVTLTLINPTSADEFHAHGYDLGDGLEIPAGEPATFTFVADLAGEFEVESHATDEVLVVLNVG